MAPYLAIISTHFSYKICILRQVSRILSMLPFWIKVFYITSSILDDLQPPITTSCGPIIGHWQVTKAPPERRPECFYEPDLLRCRCSSTLQASEGVQSCTDMVTMVTESGLFEDLL